jgi:hypothetical protein
MATAGASFLLSAALAVAAVLVPRGLDASRAPQGPGAVAVRRAGPAYTPTPGAAADWKEIDRLIEQQKLAEASAKAEAILQRAIRAKDEDEWTRALVRCVQLRTGLHGYETAVHFLKEQPWPEGLLPRVTLELYYAHALADYARAYSGDRSMSASSPPGHPNPEPEPIA